MNIQWVVTAIWAGNLRNVPLVGTIIDYKQKTPGQMVVVILCEPGEVAPQVGKLTNPNEPWCSGITITPFFAKYPELYKEYIHDIIPSVP